MLILPEPKPIVFNFKSINMTTQRKKLLKLLGDANLRDFASDEEMVRAKALQELMISNDKPPERKRTHVRKIDNRTDTEKAAQV